MVDDPIVLHLGRVHGHAKQVAWQKEGYWNADFAWKRREGGIALAALLWDWWLLGIGLVPLAILGFACYWRAKHGMVHRTAIDISKIPL